MTVIQASGVNSQPPFEISQEASFFYRPVKWFRAEDLSDATKDLRKTIALALAFFLCLTIIGVITVFLASKEWKRQDTFSSIDKTDLIVIPDEQAATDVAEQEAQQAAQQAAELKAAQEAERLASLEAELKKERERDAQEARRIADKQAAIEAERNANLEAERKALEEAKNKKRDQKPIPVEDQTPVKIDTKTNTRNNEYPSPFVMLNRLNIYPNNREEILAKANKALTGFKGTKTEFVDYKVLQEILGSGDQLDGLYNEAKILACYILETEQWDAYAEICKENGIGMQERESFVLKIDMDSRKDFHTYLSMILRALKENKQFPSDPLSEPATWFNHRK